MFAICIKRGEFDDTLIYAVLTTCPLAFELGKLLLTEVISHSTKGIANSEDPHRHSLPRKVCRSDTEVDQTAYDSIRESC